MAAFVCLATGNMTSSATWGSADSTALISNNTGATALSTASQNSANFQPGAITVDAIALRLSARATGTPTNTLTITLYDVTSTASVVSIAVPVADLPQCANSTGRRGGWVLFSLGGSFLLTAGNNYQVRLSLNNTSTAVSFCTNGTAANWQHILRQTSGAAPGAGDDMYVLGLWTASATWTQYTVTMDSTSTATTYGSNPGTTSMDLAAGGIHVGNSTFAYGNSASTNYALKLAGPVVILSKGTFSMGTVAAPCDRTTTMELQFATTTLYGVIVSDQVDAVFNTVGQSKTAGKDVSQCFLTADATSGSTSVLTVDADPGWTSGSTVQIGSTRPANGADSYEATVTTSSSGSVTLSAAVSANFGGAVPTQACLLLTDHSVKITTDNTTRFCRIYTYYRASWTGKWFVIEYGGIAVDTVQGTITLQHWLINNFTSTASGQQNDWTGTHTGTISVTYGGMISAANINFFSFSSTAGSTATMTIEDFLAIADSSVQGGGVSLTATNLQCNRIRIYGGNGALSIALQSDGGAAASFGSKFWVLSAAGNALTFAASGSYYHQSVTFTDCVFYGQQRSVSFGIAYDITFVDCYFLPSISAFHLASSGRGRVTVVGGRSGGFGGFTPLSFAVQSGAAPVQFECQGHDMSTAGSYVQYDGKLVDLTGGNLGEPAYLQFVFVDCPGGADLGPTSGSVTNTSKDSYVSFVNWNATAGDHRVYFPYQNFGVRQSDSTTYRTAAPSERLSPLTTASPRKLLSSPKRFALASGETSTVSVYVQVDGSYNGAAPRLRGRANYAFDATWRQDVTLATHDLSTGAFVQLSAAVPTADSDCVVECYVDCDGTTGSIYIDDWSAT